MTYKFWSTDEVQKLKVLYEKGISIKRIAEALGRSRTSIEAKLGMEKLTTRKTSRLSERKKFSEGAKQALGYYDDCIVRER